jgi:tyrosine decarboxylase/aspartate 1-decarboxylase
MSLEKNSINVLQKSVSKLEEGFDHLPRFDLDYDEVKAEKVLMDVATRMWDNYPYHHPQYAGQMLKPPHPIARMAYMLSMWINPNNHALDGGKASSAMEKEAVAQIAKMFGWDTYLGHLTGGGTLANLEALWVARNIHDGKKVVASSQAHYTHNRICGVLKIPFEAVPVDDKARMCVDHLEEMLKKGDIGTVVVTLGTTGVGSVDPLDKIIQLKDRYDFRIHVDSAYGGYFGLADNLQEPASSAFAQISQVDSIVIDPHKHGLQPYGCGCILFKDTEVGRFYKHDSPYTYFSSKELHLGEISLECSRAGASAVALYATLQMYPLVRNGEFANGLSGSIRAAKALYEKLVSDDRFITPLEPDLDIVIWANKAGSTSEISKISQAVFDESEKQNLYLATFNYPSAMIKKAYPDVIVDSEYTVCMRSCLMKADHEAWLESIWAIIDRVNQGLSA